jgi:hypothetical protein
MNTRPRVSAERLLLGTISVLRTLILELSKSGALDAEQLLAAIDDTIEAHRQSGDPNKLADAIAIVASHLRTSLSEPH